ncbi:MAG: SpoIVB peptidase [Ruminiclostridium sp.]|nr:SpoIVB peptidase [Ruminiclostridium sp.]
MKKIPGILNISAALLTAMLFIMTTSYGESRSAGHDAVYTSNPAVAERVSVIPCGTPFGIKMLTDGVIVTDFGAVNGRFSQQSPAEAAGIRRGDIIKSINGVPVTDSVSVSEAVQEQPVCTIKVLRDGDEMTFTAKALESDTDGRYRLGMWTKDSVAGIGTMTYYDPAEEMFAGLVHGVSDSVSGVRMPLLSGEITAVTITDIIRGESGSPGELCGAFISSVDIGTLTVNSDLGVFGKCGTAPVLSDPVEIAHSSEVNTGKAFIYTTTGGMMPERYDIEIVSIDHSSSSPTRNMTIKITDSELLARTGGIVQGMSGSPIIQNGRLVGAVTHVLVNDAAMGYAVFAENMYAASHTDTTLLS